MRYSVTTILGCEAYRDSAQRKLQEVVVTACYRYVIIWSASSKGSWKSYISHRNHVYSLALDGAPSDTLTILD